MNPGVLFYKASAYEQRQVRARYLLTEEKKKIFQFKTGDALFLFIDLSSGLGQTSCAQLLMYMGLLKLHLFQWEFKVFEIPNLNCLSSPYIKLGVTMLLPPWAVWRKLLSRLRCLHV